MNIFKKTFNILPSTDSKYYDLLVAFFLIIIGAISLHDYFILNLDFISSFFGIALMLLMTIFFYYGRNKDNKILKTKVPVNLITARNEKPVNAEVDKYQEIIESFLKDNGIGYEQINRAYVGPAVTTYSFQPTKDVKIQEVLDLKNDLSYALLIHPIRIEAPIPNTNLIGIEVPNPVRKIVGLREELINEDYKKQSGDLTICLGRNYQNISHYANLAELRHLIIGGAANSGKTSFLHSTIISLLTKHSPQTLRLLLIDVIGLELTGFNGIPHLLEPVVTKTHEAINTFKRCVDEMDRRFEILVNAKEKNIVDFNRTAKEKMPYIILIVDELADLMVKDGKEMEGNILRLAQMAKAVGIHMILATQRPCIENITGLMKASIPARIAFSTASSDNSYVILDCEGAEKLLGKGDMLFISKELSKPIRLQAPYVSEEDIKKIVDYLKIK